ncbi:response regulator transcription factor [Aeromicrobium sp. Leaf350]|uniref:response regulator transcription factor n=1 Tax=Aeromicrobium sp. Leaf350 TaxID=2876565 RepID=UPI001E5429E7|nr:response regulator transcription factor [Aeromicrobium sp. Leaf350]
MRVLVVDDEVQLAEGIRRGLEAEGCAVDVAHDGIDGLWYATEHPYDVIVLDVMMPGHSGWTVVKKLREEGNWTPVLMLTARDTDADQVQALDGGADDYLTKPFSFTVLVARLRALARRGAPERPAVLEVGDVVLDPAARTISRAGTPVPLTTRELAVAEFLLRRAGQVVSKLDVLAGVWDEAFDGDPNIVEVYVGHVRRKLDRPFGRASLQTVRGAGYLWNVQG